MPGNKPQPVNIKQHVLEGVVTSVNVSEIHSFSKYPADSITLVEGAGVKGDAHGGKTVQHLSRMKSTPASPNLRQVHLIHSELFECLEEKGFEIRPGDIGENITTRGIRLLDLPVGTVLLLGKEAAVKLTGLRNPCSQLDDFKTGLMNAVLGRDENGNIVRKAGVMSVVIKSGMVERGDRISVTLPQPPFKRLEPV